MTRLIRSKSCTLGTSRHTMPLDPSIYQGEEEEDEEDEGHFGDFTSDEGDEEEGEDSVKPATTPFINPAANGRGANSQPPHFSVLALVATALRRSLVTCTVDQGDVASDVDIGWPTDVRHVSHVTFDRFNGFLGLPVELQTDVPRKPPSASARVFGVSAQSMQCSYDERGNSVPIILLRMQSRLYSEGGLQAEGIFRINAENSEEENVRDQLNNKGIIASGIDIHCLSGLIKAWFRELPSGVLDSVTPEQVMYCNTEEECTELIKLLPPTEAALLDWAINLMADVVEQEHHNKMNARNIAMVFAPNMTQMADPLTALIHAVQVMNLLKTLILKTHREREQSSAATSFEECTGFVQETEPTHLSNKSEIVLHELAREDSSCKGPTSDNSSISAKTKGPENVDNDTFHSFRSKSDLGEKHESIMDRTSPVLQKGRTLGHSFRDEYENAESEGFLNRLGLRKGIEKLRRHPVFQLSMMSKKSGGVEV